MEPQESATRKIIIALIIGLILGFMMGAFWKGRSVSESPLKDLAQGEIVGPEVKIDYDNANLALVSPSDVKVDDQLAGNSVKVKSVSLSVPSWVAVREEK